MEEPLPPRARNWLASAWGECRRAGEAVGPGRLGGRRRVPGIVVAGVQPSRRMPDVLSSEPSNWRAAGSMRSRYRRDALGDLDQAAEVLKRGLRNAVGIDDYAAQLELSEWRSPTGPEGKSRGRARSGQLGRVAGRLDRPEARAIQALTSAVVALEQLGRGDGVAELKAEISRRFARFSRSEMGAERELVLRVLHTAGTTDSACWFTRPSRSGTCGTSATRCSSMTSSRSSAC